MEKAGIKETKEAVLGLVVLGAFVAERLKDGAGMDDLSALVLKLLDADFKAKLEAAVTGMNKIGEEVSDISLSEAIELIGLLPEILEVFKKKWSRKSS